MYQKDYKNALTIFNQVLATDPNLTVALDNKAISLANLGERGQALKLFDRSISLNSSDTWYNLGRLLDQMNNWNQGLVAFEKALSLTPQYSDVKWNRNLTGMVLLKANDFSQAVQVFDAMLKVSYDPAILEARNYAESQLFKSGGSSLP